MQLVQTSKNLQNCRDHSAAIDSGSFSHALLFIDGEFSTIPNIFTVFSPTYCPVHLIRWSRMDQVVIIIALGHNSTHTKTLAAYELQT